MKRFAVIKDNSGKAESLSIPHIQRIEEDKEGCIVHYLRPADNVKEEWRFELSIDSVTEAINETLEEAEEKGGNNKNRCPICDRPIKICKGKFGFFIGCSGYPKCTWCTTMEDWMEAKEDPQKWAEQKASKGIRREEPGNSQ